MYVHIFVSYVKPTNLWGVVRSADKVRMDFICLFFWLHSTTFHDKSKVLSVLPSSVSPFPLFHPIGIKWVIEVVLVLKSHKRVDYLLLAANDKVNSKDRNKASTSLRLLSCIICCTVASRGNNRRVNTASISHRIAID